MRHASLFSGIGGFDYAAQLMEWKNVFHCEINKFCQKFLKHYWPLAITHEDIKTTDFSVYRGEIDILTGGFPCQPFSTAGRQLGTEDDRHLWPEMLRAIREIQPRWVVGENVRGLISWNGGMVFEQVQVDLEAEGYEVIPFLLPAAGIDAPHRRERIWFVAHALSTTAGDKSGAACYEDRTSGKSWSEGLRQVHREIGTGGANPTDSDVAHSSDARAECMRSERQDAVHGFENAANTNSKQRREGRRHKDGSEPTERYLSAPYPWNSGSAWEDFPTQSPICGGTYGLSGGLARYITEELKYEISKASEKNRIENLHEVWQRIQQKEVWEEIRGLYSLESKNVLYQTMQLYQAGNKAQDNLSPFSEKFSGKTLRFLQRYGEFRNSPQGWKLEKQRSIKSSNALQVLPHEIALAARRFEASIAKFKTWHRNESIKAYGNAIVPQVVLQIFKAIRQYENQTK